MATNKKPIPEILELFQNGETRFEQDETFNKVVQLLHNNIGVYAVLDTVIKDYSALRKKHFDLIAALDHENRN